MRTTPVLLAAAALLLVALHASAAPPVPAPYCQLNHDLFQDQYVTYDGFTHVVVGVRFLDGSPTCQVQVVCWGETFECVLPPLP